MTDDTLDIQELVSASGVPRRTIYFYVQQGLLPPPNGAGLAAHYTDGHLLRLQLIPILRQQGLRLDEIRERFSKMSLDEMRGILQSAQQPAPSPVPADTLPARSMPGLPPVLPAISPPGWDARHYTHYTFPGGITLSVPDNLSSLDRQRLDQLLQAARRIFFTVNRYVASGDHGPEDPSNGKPSSI